MLDRSLLQSPQLKIKFDEMHSQQTGLVVPINLETQQRFIALGMNGSYWLLI